MGLGFEEVVEGVLLFSDNSQLKSVLTARLEDKYQYCETRWIDEALVEALTVYSNVSCSRSVLLKRLALDVSLGEGAV